MQCNVARRCPSSRAYSCNVGSDAERRYGGSVSLRPQRRRADQASEQGVAMLGRTMMPARRDVAGDHRADRFEPLPAHIALVVAGLQRKPVGAGALRRIFTPTPLATVSCRHGRATE